MNDKLKTIIGLDYDGTITRDSDMWHAVMLLMQSYGHEVHIVTMRHGVESTMGLAPMEQRFLEDADGVHFTGNAETGDRDAKRPHMDAKGIEVHVWIDDNPKAVHMSAREIWGWCTNPGDPMIHSAPEAQAQAKSERPETFEALRALTEALLTRASNAALRHWLNMAVGIMADRDCSPPVPWPDESFGVAVWNAKGAAHG
jgi:hypothetical protein